MVIDKLQQDFEVENSEKRQAGDFSKAGELEVRYLFEVGMGELGSCEEAVETVGPEKMASE